MALKGASRIVKERTNVVRDDENAERQTLAWSRRRSFDSLTIGVRDRDRQHSARIFSEKASREHDPDLKEGRFGLACFDLGRPRAVGSGTSRVSSLPVSASIENRSWPLFFAFSSRRKARGSFGNNRTRLLKSAHSMRYFRCEITSLPVARGIELCHGTPGRVSLVSQDIPPQ